MSLIAQNLKKIRTVKGINQQKLADLLGLSRASIGAYEEGRAEPKIETLIILANNYKLDLGRLINAELTVNEIHGFHKSEDKVIDTQSIVMRPTKIKELKYYTTNKAFLKEHKNQLSWPIPSKGNFVAAQLKSNFTIILEERKITPSDHNKYAIHGSDDALKIGIITHISEKGISIDGRNLDTEKSSIKYIQWSEHSSTEDRLTRIENILSSLKF